MEQVQRQVAHKISLADLQKGSYVTGEGWTPNVIRLGSTEIGRVQLIGIVISHTDSGFVLDDGSASISVRSFDSQLEVPAVGSVLSLVGRPREFQNQRYVIPEGYSIVEQRWMRVRKKELEAKTYETSVSAPPIENNKTPKEAVEAPAQIIEEEVVTEDNPLDILLDKIKGFDSGDGASYEDISTVCDDAMIQRLLEAGEIFEIRPGRYKVLE